MAIFGTWLPRHTSCNRTTAVLEWFLVATTLPTNTTGAVARPRDTDGTTAHEATAAWGLALLMTPVVARVSVKAMNSFRSFISGLSS